MKTSIFAFLALFASLAAHAEEVPALDATRAATLLAHENVAKCFSEIQGLNKIYELSASIYGTESKGTKDGVTTTIAYDLIEGGDIMAGRAELVIEERYGSSMWGPEIQQLYVVGCKVVKNIHE